MLRSFLAAAAVAFILLASSGALALPPSQAPIDPGGPIVEPPVDPCIEFPQLCEPEPPTDPCAITADLCLPEDPPVALPEPSFSHSFAGSAKVKGDDFKSSEAYTLQMNFDTTALTFLAMDGDGTLYSGNLVPKGKNGDKFRLFLDDVSVDALSLDVARRGAAASGSSAGPVLGESSKLVLKLGEEGSASLKMRSEVLVSGVGEVVFKANLVDPGSVAP